MAGYIIDNLASGVIKQWYLRDIDKLPKDNTVTFLDVRTINEFNAGHIAGFINIPVDELRENIHKLPKDKPVYVICQSGLRSYVASRILINSGYDAYNFSGGFRFYDTVINDRSLVESSYCCGMDK